MIKVGTKLIYIYNSGRHLTKGKIYEVCLGGVNEYISIRDDADRIRNCNINDVFNYFKLATKHYPNNDLFKKLYPNAKVKGNFLEVEVE